MYSSIDLVDLARFIVDRINHKSSTLCASFTDDFCKTCNIRIESLVSPGSFTIGEFVFSKLSSFYRRHLVFLSSDDSSNVSYWKVV